ncbi:hypothetical protein S7335_2195 [Synechococcus sp. PCC 7335]|nr:hypothetical protein S7335_2195 [Synechococcus sp. PCC 7335]
MSAITVIQSRLQSVLSPHHKADNPLKQPEPESSRTMSRTKPNAPSL